MKISFTYQKREYQRAHRVTRVCRDIGGELHQGAQQSLELAVSCEDTVDASGCAGSAVRQRSSIALLVRCHPGPSICSSLFELGLERLRGQRAVVVRRPGATRRAFVLRSRAVRLLLLTDPLMLLRRGRVRPGLDRFLPRRFLSRCGGCCNED